LNQYPPQLPPPQQPGGYNPFNPYQGYDPNADFVPWLPGRQGPRFLPIALILGAILFCSCCTFFVGIVIGIELPGILAPSPSSQRNQRNAQPTDEPAPEESPTPEGFKWRVVYPNS